MRDKKSLGYFISGRRKVMGLTQEELGNKIGVSKSAIEMCIRDRSAVT